MRHLFRLDRRLLRASYLFWLTLFFFFLATLLAVTSGIEWGSRYASVAEPERKTALASKRGLEEVFDGIDDGSMKPTDLRLPEDEWADGGAYVIDPRDPYASSYFHYQLAELPPGPMMALAIGTTPLHPNHVLIHTRALHELFRPGTPAERTNPLLLSMGRFDFLTVLIFIIPLFAIALLHDAKARETESGIDKLLSSLGISEFDLLKSRSLQRGSLLLFIVATAVVFAGLVTGAPPARLLILLLAAFAYTLLWLLTVAALAGRSRSALGSASICLAAYVGIVLVAPGMAEATLRPVGLLEPRALADAKVRAVEREWGGDLRESERIRYVAETFWAVPNGALKSCSMYPTALKDWSMRRLADDKFYKALEESHTAAKVFDRRLDLAGAVVPTLGFRRAVEELAGSGARRSRLFEEAVMDYHTQWRERGSRALIDCARWSRTDVENAPTFQWKEPSPSSGTLALFSAGALAWSVFACFLLLWTVGASRR